MSMPVFILTRYNPGEGAVFKNRRKTVSKATDAFPYKKESNAKRAAGEQWRVVKMWR